MKSTLLLVLAVSFFVTMQAQNLASNGGFENDVTTFTVNENDFNVLRRIGAHLDAVTQTSNPASDAINVTSGMWVMKAPSSSYPRAIVTSDDKYAGMSSLHMYIKPGSATNYSSWWNHVVQQKLGTALSASKKYKATIWVRKDDTPENNAAINFFLGDKQSTTYLTKKYDLTGGTTWTKYEHIFDIPAHMALPANITRTFNWNEAVAGITLVTTMADGLSTYGGILVDDYTIEEYIETSTAKTQQNRKPLHVSDKKISSTIAGNLEIMNVNGMRISKSNISENETINVAPGIYVLKLITTDNSFIQKIIVEQ